MQAFADTTASCIHDIHEKVADFTWMRGLI